MLLVTDSDEINLSEAHDDVVLQGRYLQSATLGKLAETWGCIMHMVQGAMFFLPVGPVGSPRERRTVAGVTPESLSRGGVLCGRHRVIQLWGHVERVDAFKEQVISLARHEDLCHRVTLGIDVANMLGDTLRDRVRDGLERVSQVIFVWLGCTKYIREILHGENGVRHMLHKILIRIYRQHFGFYLCNNFYCTVVCSTLEATIAVRSVSQKRDTTHSHINTTTQTRQ